MRHGDLGLFSLGHLNFVILSSFVIGHSSLISIHRLRPSMQPPWSRYCPFAKDSRHAYKSIEIPDPGYVRTEKKKSRAASLLPSAWHGEMQ